MTGHPPKRPKPAWLKVLLTVLIVVGVGALFATGRLAAVFPLARVLLNPYAILLLLVIFVLIRMGRPSRRPRR